MWFQIELPQPVMLTELEFDSPSVGGARGGGGGEPGLPAPHLHRRPSSSIRAPTRSRRHSTASNGAQSRSPKAREPVPTR